MEAGELVSDAIVSALIGERLDDAGEAGAIFDGYPRTRAQAEALDLLLAERGRCLDHVIELCVDEDALVERITGRFTCAKCGAGYHDIFKRPKVRRASATSADRRSSFADPTTMNRRCGPASPSIARRQRRSFPITKSAGLVRRVDGMGTPDEVAAEIDAILDSTG